MDSKDEGYEKGGEVNQNIVASPIVITEVVTTRTIAINDNSNLSDPAIAELISQLKLYGTNAPTMGASSLEFEPNDNRNRKDDYSYMSDDEAKNKNDSTKPKNRGENSSRNLAEWPTPQENSSSKSNSPNLDIKFLSVLGSFSELDSSSDVSKMITIYAKNSIHINPKLNMKLKVHAVLKKDSTFSFLSNSENSVMKPMKKKSNNKGRQPQQLDGLSMLLWFKTSPESVRHLAKEKDSCIAFYDRLCRALPMPVNNMKENSRQIILLCKVNLGNMHKSDKGYSRWHQKSHPPQGCDSIKGAGKWKPDWSKNCQHKKTLVPCGTTDKSSRFSSYELDYNEYLVFRAKNIKVKYAVDIELTTKTKKMKD